LDILEQPSKISQGVVAKSKSRLLLWLQKHYIHT